MDELLKKYNDNLSTLKIEHSRNGLKMFDYLKYYVLYDFGYGIDYDISVMYQSMIMDEYDKH